MIKTLLLLTFAFTFIAIPTAQAQEKQALYVKVMPEIELSTVQGAGAKAVACAKLTHTDLVVANTLSYRVIRDKKNLEIWADGKELKTETSDQRLVREFAGEKAGGVSNDFPAKLKKTPLTDSAKLCWVQFVELAHNKTNAYLWSVSIEKREGLYYSTITMSVYAPSAEYFADVASGKAIRLLDVIN